MLISLFLLAFAGVVAAIASRALPTAAWVARAPRTGLATWHIVPAAIIASAAGALVSLFAHWPATVEMACAWWALCARALNGSMGAAAQGLGWLTLLGTAAAAWPALRRIAVAVRALRRSHRQQRDLLTVIGRPDPELEALIVDHPSPAAYVLSGRSGEVVVTSGAIERLPREQLAAVLAHERAHATGRHHHMLRLAHVLATAFPSVYVFTHAHRQIERLVEICADEAAAARHRRIDLARALVACAEARTGTPVPAGAPAAHGADALERVQRLLTPPKPLPAAAQLLLAFGMLGLLAIPPALVTSAYLFPALAFCVPTAA